MPNWCENSVTLTHSDTSKVSELEDVLRNCPIEYGQFEDKTSKKQTKFFEHYLPRPSDVSENNVCDWNEKVWGTEWEPQIISITKDNSNTISISMDTPWTPPIGLYTYFVEREWTVEALYHEPGYAFCGRFTNESGNECYDYNKQDKTTYNQIPHELLEFTCILDDSDNGSDDDIDNDSNDDSDSDGDSDGDSDDEVTKLYKLYNRERKTSLLCFNKVTLSNNDTKFIDELESALLQSIEDTDYEVFNLLFPRPEELDEETDEYTNVLDWNNNAWGTRCEPEVLLTKRINNTTIEFTFNTSYTPPIHLYRWLVEENWEVNAFYHQQDAQFCGCFNNKQGNIQYDYDNSDTSSLTNIPHDILKFSGLL